MKALALILALALPARALAGDVVPVMEGKPAPFSGLLVPEDRFTKLMEAELGNDELRARLAIEQRFNANLEKLYQKKQEEAAKAPAWYETPTFHLYLGITIGVAVTALAVYGGARVVEASNGR